VTPQTVWTVDQSEEKLCESLTTFSTRVRALCTAAPTDNELGALTSLAYNIGAEALRKSTVLRCHNASDCQAAARAFSLWDKARVNGALQALPGLTARRAAEAALYLRPDDEAPQLRMPQAVADESRLTASPIARTGAVTAGAGLIGVVGDAGQSLGSVGTITQQARTIVVEHLGLPVGAILPVVMVAAGAAVIWWRIAQRRSGWC
jgi:lysozyme